jgi:filamentous hemagglutinin family protein
MARPWPIPHPLARCLVAVVIVLGGGQAALALPEGMVVQGGQLELQQLDANNALLRQGTGRAAADFNSFNIHAGQRLQILQPDASSTLLGRVINGQITEIHGRLDANGRVLLINPAGVLVGPGGVVNTAAFTATTLHVDHQRFLQGGAVELKKLPGADTEASVINRGTINVSDGGFAALIAPNVVNDGLITARLGQIQLSSGTAATLDISGDGLLSVALDPAVAGTITNNGSLRASHVRLGGGDAAVLAAATVQQNGLIEARSIGELLGGRITIEGAQITVGRGAVLDASGPNGGGTILVGGSWQNSDPTVRQATTTTIEAGAVLDASATSQGNGGTVVAWSDIHDPASVTRVNGTLRAQGGPNGGDGGRIETSGYALNIHGIQIDASAPLGQGGEWLIDPYNITISSGSQTGVDSNFTAIANDAVINVSNIVTALNSGTNVTVSTGSSGTQAGDITVAAAISSSGNATLKLQAARDIKLNESITLSGASSNLQLVAGRSISQASGRASSVGGNISFTARDIFIAANLTSTSGDITLVGDTGSALAGAFHGVHVYGSGVKVKTEATDLVAGATGAISVRGRGGDAVEAGSGTSPAYGVYLQGGASISAGGSGDVSVTGIGGVSTTDSYNSGVLVSNSNANNGVSEIISAGGDIIVTGTGGGASGSGVNYGVSVNSFARIAAGASGTVGVTGTATETGGTGNSGVIVTNFNAPSQAAPTAAITSAGGEITITGTGTADGAAVVLRNAGKVTSGGSGNVTIVADSVRFDTASAPATLGSITAGSSGSTTATIRPRTAGTLIDLGGTDVLSGTPLTLGLSTAEIARITAATLVVGSTTAGSISVSQSLALAPGMNLSLMTGAGLTQTAPLRVAGTSTIATGSADALLSNSSNFFGDAFAFTGRSLQLASSTPLLFAASTLLGDLTVTTTNGAISQSGPLVVAGRTTLTTGSGNITLMNLSNRFGVMPLTINSSGLVAIEPCIATSSCITTVLDTTEARQDVLTSNPGLSQQNQLSVLQSQKAPAPAPVTSRQTQAGPYTPTGGPGKESIRLGQGNLDFSQDTVSCNDPAGCGPSSRSSNTRQQDS